MKPASHIPEPDQTTSPVVSASTEADAPRPNLAYRAVRASIALVLRAFYREIRVEGRDLIPPAGPLLVVANHHNGVIDPSLIGISLGRPLRLTAKSTLAGVPVLGALMRAFGVVLIHRQKDREEGADPERNPAALDSIVQALCQGEAIALFPEGISHDERGLTRFKHGASWTALGAAEQRGGAPVWVLPCALVFEDRWRPRSRVRVRYGQPIEVAAWRRERPRATPRDLTARLRQDVEDLLVMGEASLPTGAARARPAMGARLLALACVGLSLPLILVGLAAFGPALGAAWLVMRRGSPDRHSDLSWFLYSLAALLPAWLLILLAMVGGGRGLLDAGLLALALPVVGRLSLAAIDLNLDLIRALDRSRSSSAASRWEA